MLKKIMHRRSIARAGAAGPRRLLVAPGPLSTDPLTRDSAEDPDRTPRRCLACGGHVPAPCRSPPDGPTLVTTLADSRTVLTHPVDFELPFDVSRQRIRRAEGPGKATPPLSPAAVAVGRQTLVDELAAAEPSFSGSGLDTLVFLRDPVARSTTAALVPEADIASRNEIAGLVLAWIDALAPIISAARSPRRWSRPTTYRAARASRPRRHPHPPRLRRCAGPGHHPGGRHPGAHRRRCVVPHPAGLPPRPPPTTARRPRRRPALRVGDPAAVPPDLGAAAHQHPRLRPRRGADTRRTPLSW